MKSMTGYAYRELTTDEVTVSVEIKSCNSRFLDLSVSLPSFLNKIEGALRETASQFVSRGKVDVYVKIRETNAKLLVEADTGAAAQYAEAMGVIAAALGQSREIPLSLVVAQEGVLTSRRTKDGDWYLPFILPVFTDCFKSHSADREREGRHLFDDMSAMLAKLEEAADLFARRQPQMEETFRDSIKKRFDELLGSAADPQRVMQETAALLVKYTINEEIIRLKSHLSALKTELTQNPAPGKRIDFICQELNREINTIGSKNQCVEVGQAIITAKESLENIREQARNVE